MSSFETLKDNFAVDMTAAAPDLATNNLAQQIANTLFNEIGKQGATENELVEAGQAAFYEVGKSTLGPIAVSFVDHVLQDCPPGFMVFPARDATPFHHIGQVLFANKPGGYDKDLQIVNPVLNRKTWGVDDEQDTDSPVTAITDPKVVKLLEQVGFGSGEHITFVEVGAWGSMIDSFNTAFETGDLAPQDLSVYFLFTHMPEYIYGYLNQHAGSIPPSVLEAVADSFEGLPKHFKRPTSYIEQDGQIFPDMTGKMIDSPFLKPWSEAVLLGFEDAAHQFCSDGIVLDPHQLILDLGEHSVAAKQGQFNGMLPGHTETWSEGPAWKESWKWGTTLPLKKEQSDVQ